jgi:glycosyltransferase involved in cell wall biosynthesis
MNILHISDGWEETNGAAVIARKIAESQALEGHEISFASWASPARLRRADEVWIHCAWKPCLWWAALFSRSFVRVPGGSFDPVRLAYGRWKKRIVSPIEKFFLRKASRVVVTCKSEGDWVLAYQSKAKTQVLDCKNFKWGEKANCSSLSDGVLRVLYMGRKHPLKGISFLEEAIRRINAKEASSRRIELSIVTNALGKEKEDAFLRSDLFCLPTLSDNFGIVVAEALARGLRVITTDGAPVWKEESLQGDKVKYIEGFRDGDCEFRISQLERALESELDSFQGK